MKKKKVLILSTSGFRVREGIGSVLYENLSRFDFNKFEIDLIVSGKYDSTIVNKFSLLGINPLYFPDRRDSALAYYKQLYLVMKNNKYDVFYANGSSALLYPDLLISHICGCKQRIVHSHNTRTDHLILHYMMYPFFQREYTSALACSRSAGKWLFGRHPFEIINNGRSIPRFAFSDTKRTEMREKLGIRPGELAIGHVGSFNKQKNHRFIINMFSSYVQVNPKSHLFLVGAGEDFGETVQDVKQKKITNQVSFLGSIDYVSEFVQAMDVMVLPSIFEGLPLVAVEWQLSGVYSLISDCVTKEVLIGDGVDVLPIEKGTKIWVDKIKEYAKNDTLSYRKERSTRNAQNAKQMGFDIVDVSNTLQSILADNHSDK
ncbi:MULTISPECIES: glycosyltransferase [Lactobacillaceae]|uniref:glycosyltransferase n=1 Tax=Lactobacillaceae TaxID=33958 RepID=UPI000E08EDC6|nr:MULTISPECIES: glycosyltransferase [Lactobacillaceae]MCT3276697.1 glycosyltransferase family 1 protein [Lactiplantibacillus pentosus]MDT8952612.1 glycosyltransferase [Lacticaseibacillus paracasei subsp. paracasei]RDF80849.1 glycosyltransferase family 1 protein [Lacticaseibacillus paracasei]